MSLQKKISENIGIIFYMKSSYTSVFIHIFQFHVFFSKLYIIRPRKCVIDIYCIL